MKSKKNSSDKKIYLKRVDQLKNTLKAKGAFLCLIENPCDLEYLTGIKFSRGRLFISRDAGALFVDGRYIQIAQENSPVPAHLEEPAELQRFLKSYSDKPLLFDPIFTSYDQFLQLKKLHDNLKAEKELFRRLRAIKDPSEIVKMKESAALLYRGLKFIRRSLKEGISEREVALAFEIFCLKQRAEKLSFESIIAFGPNSAMPHYRAGDRLLKRGDLVLVDIGICLNGYHSDMTRCFAFGKKDPFFSKVYDVVVQAQRAALKLCKPKTPLGKLDEAARAVMRAHQMEEHYLHSLGHGVGKEVHEFPRISWKGEDKDLVLEKGMVITIEPGLYFPGKGGVRYEDTILITDSGYENFYPETPKL